MKAKIFKPIVFITSILVLSSFLERTTSIKYSVDTKSSFIVWTGKKVTGEHTGTVPVSAGELIVEGKSFNEGKFEIDLSSITVTDVTDEAANSKLVGHFKSNDFFSVSKHPKAKFSLTSATHETDNKYLVRGTRVINGISNEIQFPAIIVREDNKLTATAKINVDRTKFDIKFRSTNFFENLGDKAIDNNFDLDLKLVATTQKEI